MIINANKYQKKHRSNRIVLNSICITTFSLPNFSHWTNQLTYYFIWFLIFHLVVEHFYRRYLELHKNDKLWRQQISDENCCQIKNKIFILFCYFHKAKPKKKERIKKNQLGLERHWFLGGMCLYLVKQSILKKETHSKNHGKNYTKIQGIIDSIQKI